MLRGDRIKIQRQQQGLSQERLGKAIGQDHAYISRLETGIYKNLMADTLDDIAGVLGCSTDYLLGHTDNPKPRPDRIPYSRNTGIPQEEDTHSITAL